MSRRSPTRCWRLTRSRPRPGEPGPDAARAALLGPSVTSPPSTGAICRDRASPLDELGRSLTLERPELDALVRKHWGRDPRATPEERLAEVRRLNNDLRAAPGDPERGPRAFPRSTARRAIGSSARGNDRSRPDLRQPPGSRLPAHQPGRPDAVVRKEFQAVSWKRPGWPRPERPDRRADAEAVITLRDPKDERIAVARSEIEDLKESDDLADARFALQGIPPEQLRDLFATSRANSPEDGRKGPTIEGTATKTSRLLIALACAWPGAAHGPGRRGEARRHAVYENRLEAHRQPAADPGRPSPLRRADPRDGPVRGRRAGRRPRADLDVRAWRFSYNARGIIEVPNRLRADRTAVIVVHPWGIDDGQGWSTPEPAGVAFQCTPAKNRSSSSTRRRSSIRS